MLKGSFWSVCISVHFCRYFRVIYSQSLDVLLQIAGTGVLAIGIWLRLDPKTKSLFEGDNSPYIFYTGQYGFLCVAACEDQPVKVKRVCCRCVHPHCGRRADDGCWFFWMLWCHPGVPLHAGIGNPPHYILKYHYFVVLWCYQPWCLTVVVFSPQFFFFLLVIFAVEVAAGIWGFSNQTKVGVSNAQCTRKHTDGAPNSSYYDCVHRLLTI